MTHFQNRASYPISLKNTPSPPEVEYKVISKKWEKYWAWREERRKTLLKWHLGVRIWGLRTGREMEEHSGQPGMDLQTLVDCLCRIKNRRFILLGRKALQRQMP